MLVSFKLFPNFNFLDSSNQLDRKLIMYRDSLGEHFDIKVILHIWSFFNSNNSNCLVDLERTVMEELGFQENIKVAFCFCGKYMITNSHVALQSSINSFWEFVTVNLTNAGGLPTMG